MRRRRDFIRGYDLLQDRTKELELHLEDFIHKVEMSIDMNDTSQIKQLHIHEAKELLK